MKELFNKKIIFIFIGAVVLFAVIYGITEFEIYKTKISEQEKQIADLLQEQDKGEIVESIDKNSGEEIVPEIKHSDKKEPDSDVKKEIPKNIEELIEVPEEVEEYDGSAPALYFSDAIAQIVCGADYNEYTDDYDSYYSGSGSIWFVNDNYWVLTNEHVLTGTEECYVIVTIDWVEAIENYDKAIEEDNILIYYLDPYETFYIPEDGYDLSYGVLEEIEQSIEMLDYVAMLPDIENCNEYYNIGTEVQVFGYPGIGSSVVVTLTEGIISSFEKIGNAYYYLTSAKIEEGNSGGMAFTDITENSSCVVGIPTFVETGSMESLGRILAITEEEINYWLSTSNP